MILRGKALYEGERRGGSLAYVSSGHWLSLFLNSTCLVLLSFSLTAHCALLRYVFHTIAVSTVFG